MELVELDLAPGSLDARGMAIGIAPLPYRLEYALTTEAGFATPRLLVASRGAGWRRTLDLQRTKSGGWSCLTECDGAPQLPAPGGDLSAVQDALDCDLEFSPLTNTMPVLRHQLHLGGGPIGFLMAWVSVPDLAVHTSRQRYTFVRREQMLSVVRFEALDDLFTADITFDEQGLVVDYPGLARQVA